MNLLNSKINKTHISNKDKLKKIIRLKKRKDHFLGLMNLRNLLLFQVKKNKKEKISLEKVKILMMIQFSPNNLV